HPQRVQRRDQQASNQDTAADRCGGLSSFQTFLRTQREGSTGEEHKRRRTKVRHPANQELDDWQRCSRFVQKCSVGNEPASSAYIGSVVYGHHYHNQASHPIECDHPWGNRHGLGLRSLTLSYGHSKSLRPFSGSTTVLKMTDADYSNLQHCGFSRLVWSKAGVDTQNTYPTPITMPPFPPSRPPPST